MRRPARGIACLAAALLATSCTVYKIRQLDAKALAAKGRRGRIISVQTTTGLVGFSEKDPVEVKDGAILGSSRGVCWVDPFTISEITNGKSGHRVVLKNGRRFRVASSRTEGPSIECEAVESLVVPLDEVVTAKVRVKDAAASILGTLGAVVLVVGALALDDALKGDDEDPEYPITDELVSGFFEGTGEGGGGGSGREKSNQALLGAASGFRAAAETEFWTMEWKPVDAQPGEDGRIRVRLENPARVPCGIDEAKLVVVDHAADEVIIPNILGTARACPAPVPPDEAVDGSGTDVRDLIRAHDDVIWRSPEAGPTPAGVPPRGRLTLSFPRPKGLRWAKLIVTAANSSWRSEFAREIQAATAAKGPVDPSAPEAAPAKGYEEWEYGKLRMQLLTVFGWRTAQLIYASGPVPDFDLIYDIDLGDVLGDKVWIRISPPAGYWLIDRLALDFTNDVTLEPAEIVPEGADGADAAEVVAALAAEDSNTVHFAPGDPPALLTFVLPPAKEGLKRTVFLRTVNCYETRGDNKGAGS